jgi:hypothetical protein
MKPLPHSFSRLRNSGSRWRSVNSAIAEVGDHVGDRRPLGDAEVGRPRARELEHLVLSTRGADAPQKLEDDVLGLNPGPRELALEPDLDHLGAGDLVRVTAEHDGHVEAAGADRDHSEAARLGGVGVSAQHRLAGLAEALHVDVVAYPVAGAREVQPVPARQRLEHAVVVGVLVIELDDVVVDVLDGTLDLDARLALPRTASAPSFRWRPGAAPGPCGSRSACPASAPRRRGAPSGSGGSG